MALRTQLHGVDADRGTPFSPSPWHWAQDCLASAIVSDRLHSLILGFSRWRLPSARIGASMFRFPLYGEGKDSQEFEFVFYISIFDYISRNKIIAVSTTCA